MKCIHVLRKPCSESTVAGNVLKFGCGAINVDATRIQMTLKDREVITSMGGFGSEGWANTTSPTYNTNNPKNPMVRTPAIAHSQGRWPANLVLQHLDGCEQTGTREEAGYSVNRFTDGAKPFGGGAGHPYESEQVPPSTVPVWACAPGCPVAALDAQSGVSKSTGGRASIGAFKGGRVFGVGNGAEALPGVQPGLGDTGGASRFFKQFVGKPE